MSDRAGYIEITDLNNVIFTDTKKDDYVMYTETSNQSILFGTLLSNVSAMAVRSNNVHVNNRLAIGTSNPPPVSLYINATDAALLPSGTTAQRPAAPLQGYVRYNTQLNTFEGFGAGSAWGSLGGVKDTNQDTYISAESFPTSNDDILRFFTSNNEVARIMPNGRLGLSNQAPTERLHVSGGNAKFDSNVYVISRLGVATSNPGYEADVLGSLNATNIYEGAVAIATKYALSNIIYPVANFASNAAVSASNKSFVTTTTQWTTSGNNIYYTTGQVAIGTTTPTEALDVTSNIKAASNIYVGVRMGIATSNPTAALDINTTDAIVLPRGTTAQRPGAAAQGQVRYNTTLSTFEGYGAGNTWGSLGGVKDTNQDTYVSAESFPTSNDDAIHFVNSNTETATLSQSKLLLNVPGHLSQTSYVHRSNATPFFGIGLSNPTAPLHVLGATLLGGSLTLSNLGTASLYTSNNYLGVGTSNPTEALQVQGNTKVTGSTYVMSNLGVGLSNPSLALEVNGSAKIRSNLEVTGNLTVLGNSTVISANQLNIADNTILVNDGAVYNPTLQAGIEVNRGSGCNNAFVLFEEATDYFKVGFQGSLQAIATRDDALPLDSIPIYNPTLSKFSASSNLVYKAGTNRLGVATSNPTEALDATGNIRASSNVYALSRLSIGHSNPTEALDATGNIKASSNLYVLQSLAVGKSNPSYPVDIAGNTAIDGSVNATKYVLSRGMQIKRKSGTYFSPSTLPTGTVLGFSNDTLGAVFSISSNQYANYFKFVAGPSKTELARLTGTGQLGLGTQTPAETLHTIGKVLASDQFLSEAAYVFNPSYSFRNDSNTGMYNPAPDSLALVTNGTERVRVDDQGRLGIGTTPQEPLHVVGKAYSTTQFISTSNDSTTIPSFSFREDSNTGIYHASNLTMGLVSGGVEVARVGPSNIVLNNAIFDRAPQAYSIIDQGTSSLNVPGYSYGTISASSNTPFTSPVSFGSPAEGSLYIAGTSNSYIELPTSLVVDWSSVGGFTVEAWVFHVSYTTSGVPVLLGNITPRGGLNYWSFGVTSSGTVAFFYVNPGATTVATSTTVPLNTWTHIAMSYDGTNIRLFINGTLGQTTAKTGTPQASTTTPLTVNAYNNTSGGEVYISSLRMVTGATLYTASFTPSTIPLAPSTSGTTRLLLRSPQVQGRTTIPCIGGTSTVRAYPPVALTGSVTNIRNTSYGAGTYIASSSTEYSSAFAAYLAFDKNTTGSSYWSDAQGGYNSSGAYTGSVTTVDTAGNSYPGGWIQLQMPQSIVLTSYSIAPYANTNFTPSRLHVLGSTDGTRWTILSTQTGITGISTITGNVTTSLAFNYFRLVVNSLQGLGTYNAIMDITFNGTQESMYIATDGQVGLGVARPTLPLEVAGNAAFYGNISAGNLGMFRNRIINGDMRIDQRNNGAASTSFANGTGKNYFVDRWYLWSARWTTFTASVQRVTDVPSGQGFTSSLKITATAFTAGASTTSYILSGQAIEGYNLTDLGWGTAQASPVTLSFWVKSSRAGTFTLTIETNQNETSQYLTSYTVFSPATWEYKSLVVPGDTLDAINTTNDVGIYVHILSQGTYTALAAGWRYTVSPSWTYNVTGTTNPIQAANDYFQYTGVQLEKGTIATPFEFRPFALELQLCQRYFWAVGAQSETSQTNYPIFGNGYWQNSTFAWIQMLTPVPMRDPTLSSVSVPVSTSALVTHNGGVFSTLTFSKNSHGHNVFSLGVTKSGGTAAANQLAVLYDNAVPPTTRILINNEL